MKRVKRALRAALCGASELFAAAVCAAGLGFFLNQTGLLAGPAAALAAAAAFSAGAAGLLYGDRDVESALVELVSSEGRV